MATADVRVPLALVVVALGCSSSDDAGSPGPGADSAVQIDSAGDAPKGTSAEVADAAHDTTSVDTTALDAPGDASADAPSEVADAIADAVADAVADDGGTTVDAAPGCATCTLLTTTHVRFTFGLVV